MRRVVAVLLAALCFSTTGTAQSLAQVDASSLAIGASRILIGGSVLGLIAIVTAHRAAPFSTTPPTTRQVWPIVLMGVVGVLAYQPAFFLGVRLNGVTIGTIVALGSAPIVTGALNSALRRQLPSPRWLAATGLATVGVILISGLFSSTAERPIEPIGIASSIAAGAAYALYILASKALLSRSWAPQATMGTIFGIAALISAPVLLLAGAGWFFTLAGITLALWLGLITTAIAYLLFAWGLQHLDANTVSTLTLAEPLGATLLGTLVLHEELSATSIAGVLALSAGLVIVSLRPRPLIPRSSLGA